MATTHTKGGTRLVPSWKFDPIARPFDRFVAESAARWMPAVNVEETADELVLTADLPGFNEESIEIGLEKGVLTLSGRLAEEPGTGDRRYHLRERRLYRFQRSFRLPATISASAVTATFNNGVLHVHMPKAPEAKAQTIPIRRAS